MKIRRIQYNIDYTHILTFKEEYKYAILPYFGFENLRYAIDNENTINESMRLIFTNENLALFIRKEGISFLYEGDIKDLKKQTGIIKFFWDIYNNIKTFKGYKKTNRHSIIAIAVKLSERKEIDKLLGNPPFRINPFGKLEEFATLYEYKNGNRLNKFSFGNFSEKDIKQHDLTPFNSDYNKDLYNAVGVMSKLEIIEECNNPSFSKFKDLLTEEEKIINSFKL